MLRDLKREVDRELTLIGSEFSERDRAVLAAAHRIKNSASLIGAHRLADAAVQVERLAGAGGGPTGAADADPVSALREQWSETQRAIDSDLGQAD
jgi:HPt (histidine-containing phosphotransfer) domain-containing protein